MTVIDHLASRPLPVEGGGRRYSITIDSHSPRLIVARASGELDMTARSDLATVLGSALRDETVVLLDLSTVTFMYAGAAKVIMDSATQARGRLEIFAPTRPARRILDALGAARLMTDPRAA